jgi:hypothetical protein
LETLLENRPSGTDPGLLFRGVTRVSKRFWRWSFRLTALAGAVPLLAGCGGPERIPLKDVGYVIEAEPSKKIEELPKNMRPKKGQSSSRISRDPSGVNRN